jgi:hypothetical protein
LVNEGNRKEYVRCCNFAGIYKIGHYSLPRNTWKKRKEVEKECLFFRWNCCFIPRKNKIVITSNTPEFAELLLDSRRDFYNSSIRRWIKFHIHVLGKWKKGRKRMIFPHVLNLKRTFYHSFFIFQSNDIYFDK